MASLAFDTLAAARRLKKVGMEESHAEAVAESLRDAVTGSVATRQDLGAAKLELREEIAAVKAGVAAVEAEITGVEARLREETAAVRTELREEIAGVKAEIAGVEARLREEIAGVKAEIAGVKAEIAGVEARLREEIAGVKAEVAGVEARVAAVEAKLREEIAGVKAEIRAQRESTDARLDAHGQALDRIERQFERLSADHRTRVRWIVGSALALAGLMVTMLKFVQTGGG